MTLSIRQAQTWYLGLALVLIVTGPSWADWTHWRGANQQGTSAETGLPSSWSPDGENLLWDAALGCRSTPLILNDRVYMISRAGEGETRQERECERRSERLRVDEEVQQALDVLNGHAPYTSMSTIFRMNKKPIT